MLDEALEANRLRQIACAVCVETVERGKLTKDLAPLWAATRSGSPHGSSSPPRGSQSVEADGVGLTSRALIARRVRALG